MVKIKVSSTGMGSSNCDRKFKLTVIDGYKPKLMGASMVYGIAVHKFLDTMFKTKGHYPTARKEAEEIFHKIPAEQNVKSPWLHDPKHLITTCFNAWTEYVEAEQTFDLLDLNGSPASEITFSIPYFKDEFIDVTLEGTIDGVGQFKGGCFAIRDWKTTSQWNPDKYLKQYELNRQLRIYRLACKIMKDTHPDSILGKIAATKMGAFIDGIFLKSKPNDTEFHRSDVFQFDDGEIEQTHKLLIRYCKKLSMSVQHNDFEKEGIMNGSCITPYGLCTFWNVCKSPTHIADLLLKRDFNCVPYEPLSYND